MKNNYNYVLKIDKIHSSTKRIISNLTRNLFLEYINNSYDSVMGMQINQLKLANNLNNPPKELQIANKYMKKYYHE